MWDFVFLFDKHTNEHHLYHIHNFLLDLHACVCIYVHVYLILEETTKLMQEA